MNNIGLYPRSTKRQMVLATVRPTALILSVLYFFLTYQVFSLGNFVVSMTVLTMAIPAALFLLVAGLTHRLQPTAEWGHPLMFILSAVLLGAISIESVLTASGMAQTALPLTILGTGMVMYSRRWIAGTILLAVSYVSLSWIGGQAFLPGMFVSLELRIQTLGSIAVAGFMAFVVAEVRSRIYGEWSALQTATHSKEAELEKSRSRFALSMAGSNDGLYDWEHSTSEVYYSPRWKEILGFGEHEIGTAASETWDRVHPDDIDRVKGALVGHFNEDTLHFEQEFRMLHKDGEYRWILMRGASIRNEERRVIRMAGSMTDMSNHGVFDPLTGLPNRRLLTDRLSRAIDHQSRGNLDFAVLFIDLNRFKLINDTLGHQAGDAVLVEIASRLQSCVRASDTVSRLGGDEFVVILERIDLPNGAFISINRILEKLARPLRIDGHEIYASASLGAVLDTAGYTEPEDLLRDADTAMYQAKAENNAWALFDSSMRERFAQRLKLESELRRALEREEFFVEYQPIVSLATGETEGFEALVRWQHPEEGVISPGAFIEVMEETGLIAQLGRWVLRRACHEMQVRYPDSEGTGRPTLSVNVSRKQLTERALPDQVAAILEETGFTAERLRLEITETAIIEHADLALDTLHRIKALGVELMMDDFGTGHSSLGALQALPIDTLKIDQSFIARVATDTEGLEVVRTIIAMASHLGLKIIAEGIETEDQLTLLRESACHSGQGFFFSRPTELRAERFNVEEASDVSVHDTSPEGAEA